jgi:hypothetical protein
MQVTWDMMGKDGERVAFDIHQVYGMGCVTQGFTFWRYDKVRGGFYAHEGTYPTVKAGKAEMVKQFGG